MRTPPLPPPSERLPFPDDEQRFYAALEDLRRTLRRTSLCRAMDRLVQWLDRRLG